MNALSFHKRAEPAALALLAAGKQGKGKEYEDLLWENNQALEDGDLEGYAKQLGLDLEKFKADMKSPELKKAIDSQQAISVALGASGTPAFFVNGELLSGAKPFEEFQAVIDKQIEKANRLLDKGVKLEVMHALLSSKAVAGKYNRFVIEGKKPPSPKQEAAAAEKPPLARNRVDIAISDSPRKAEGDEVIITEFSEFQ